jgi:F-type H+-transporting ATPase subunit epsilon
MSETIHIEIFTPEKKVFSDDVDSLSAIGTEGEFQVLPNHTTFLTALQIGIITYRKEGETFYIANSDGFCEVRNNSVLILVRTAEKGEDIDITRAQESHKRAETRIQANGPDIDEMRAKLSLYRSLCRMKACSLSKASE